MSEKQKPIDRKKMRTMSTDIEAALKEVAKKHDVELKVGGGSWDDSTFSFKLEGGIIKSDGSVVTKESEDFKARATFYGLKPEHLGKVIKIDGERYEITGLSTRSRKYPIIVKRVRDGKPFKLTQVDVIGSMVEA